MGPLTYSLCNKLGLAQLAIPFCAFPPLFLNQPVTLTAGHTTSISAFVVPVSKKYPLALTFEFESNQARLSDEIVGSNGHDENCRANRPYESIPESKRAGLGRSIPLQVVIRKSSDQSVVVDKVFHSLCVSSHDGGRKKTREVAWLDLVEGEYTAAVTSLVEQPGLQNVSTRISLYSGERK